MTIADNKKAFHDYFVEEQFEAGMVLEGWEVKAIRAGKVQLKEAYVIVKAGEIFLFGANYGFRGCPDRDPASADHEQDSGTVGIASGANDVVGQCHPGFMTVDHIRADCSPLLSQHRSDSQSHEEQAAGQKFIHDDRVPVSGWILRGLDEKGGRWNRQILPIPGAECGNDWPFLPIVAADWPFRGSTVPNPVGGSRPAWGLAC